MRIPSVTDLLAGAWYQRVFRSALRRLRNATSSGADYSLRMNAEIETYKDCLDVNDLPQIFHYWSNKYLAPRFERLGFGHPDAFFAKFLEESASRIGGRPARFVSIGAGNCDTEVRVARLLRDRGLAGFTIECVDINSDMLDRGRSMAAAAGVAQSIVTSIGDFNEWKPASAYDAVMANQSLHHVMNLEGLFDSIRQAIAPAGIFITSDMIGRNGHQRWPEALEIVREFWKELPNSYRYNRQLRRQEEEFMDWDCSVGTFEGIRSQDILPLLVERFEFDMFAPFANVIDPFIDRGFGHHFDAESSRDREFIDRVHARDEAEIARGRITPAHMMAVMCTGRRGRAEYLDGLRPKACIRRPD